MSRSLLISSVFHLILIMITALSLPFLAKKPIDLPPIVSVELIQITDKTNIPVIASGGVGTLDHLYDGIVKGGASAVLAASIFHYGEYKIKEAKEYLNSKNVSVRL